MLVLGSLSVIATLLQTKGYTTTNYSVTLLKWLLLSLATSSITVNSLNPMFVELDESMLDALGILPQRKQHKKLLLVSVIVMEISFNF